MIDQSIVDVLVDLDGELNFSGLLRFMKSTGITYRNRKFKGPLGFAAYDCIYLDVDKILHYHPKLLFFVILHETAHHKRIMAMGKEKLIELLSLSDFEAFVDHVVGEEMVADRYGRYMFYKLNRESFPIEATQRLENPEMKQRYKPIAGMLFGVVQNDEGNYHRLVESFLHEE